MKGQSLRQVQILPEPGEASREVSRSSHICGKDAMNLNWSGATFQPAGKSMGNVAQSPLKFHLVHIVVRKLHAQVDICILGPVIGTLHV